MIHSIDGIPNQFYVMNSNFGSFYHQHFWKSQWIHLFWYHSNAFSEKNSSSLKWLQLNRCNHKSPRNQASIHRWIDWCCCWRMQIIETAFNIGFITFSHLFNEILIGRYIHVQQQQLYFPVCNQRPIFD